MTLTKHTQTRWWLTVEHSEKQMVDEEKLAETLSSFADTVTKKVALSDAYARAAEDNSRRTYDRINSFVKEVTTSIAEIREMVQGFEGRLVSLEDQIGNLETSLKHMYERIDLYDKRRNEYVEQAHAALSETFLARMREVPELERVVRQILAHLSDAQEKQFIAERDRLVTLFALTREEKP
jgi:hypothetical protein